jgi:hypothetical protein
MNVERAVPTCCIEQRRRQKQPVGCNNQSVRLQRPYAPDSFRVPKMRWLKNLDAAGCGEALDGAGGRTKTPPSRTIRLREHEGHLVLSVQQPRQRPFSELGRTGEN